MVRFRASAGKSNKTVSTSWSFTGDRWFESISLQRGVSDELASGSGRTRDKSILRWPMGGSRRGAMAPFGFGAVVARLAEPMFDLNHVKYRKRELTFLPLGTCFKMSPT